MRIVLQRVKNASVTVGDETVSEIGAGLLLLVAVASGDGEAEADWLARKISGLRIFNDREGKMNLSVQDAGGEILATGRSRATSGSIKSASPRRDRAPGDVMIASSSSTIAVSSTKTLSGSPSTGGSVTTRAPHASSASR